MGRKMKPYAYAVVQGVDGMENVSLQFDHPEMCGQKYRQAIPLFTHPTELTDEEILEQLAELEHHQWMMWANNIVATESISEKRKERWTSCMIPYDELSEEMKEHDRVWARQALAILRKAQEK